MVVPGLRRAPGTLARALGALGLTACQFVHGTVPRDAEVEIDSPEPDARVISDAAPTDTGPPFCDGNDSSLVACYEFDTTLGDGSVHHLDPEIAQNVTYGAGETGQALVVEASTEVDVADSAILALSAVTMEAWIDPAQLPSNRGGVIDSDGRYGVFVTSTGAIQCNAGAIVTGGTITPGQWTHVACTSDGATIRLYVSGAQVVSDAAAALPLTGSQTGMTLGGNNPPGGGDPLGGSLDELRLFSVVRSPEQICHDARALSCP